jgi:hypothetical protein
MKVTKSTAAKTRHRQNGINDKKCSINAKKTDKEYLAKMI